MLQIKKQEATFNEIVSLSFEDTGIRLILICPGYVYSTEMM